MSTDVVVVEEKKIPSKAMTISEKQRIEVLVDNRVNNLRSYIDELRTYSVEANAQSGFSKQDELDELLVEQNKFELEYEGIAARFEERRETANHLLKEEQKEKVARLEKLVEKVNTQYNLLIREHQTEIRVEQEKATEKVAKKIGELNVKKNELEVERNQEVLLRKLALTNSFSNLRAGIDDARNKAVEKLWTEVTQTGEAKEALSLIPDAVSMREMVSPERIFNMFNTTIGQLTEGKASLKCEHCGSKNITEPDHYGNIQCKNAKCRKYGKVSKEVLKIVALPSLRDIVTQSNSPMLEYASNGHSTK